MVEEDPVPQKPMISPSKSELRIHKDSAVMNAYFQNVQK